MQSRPPAASSRGVSCSLWVVIVFPVLFFFLIILEVLSSPGQGFSLLDLMGFIEDDLKGRILLVLYQGSS